MGMRIEASKRAILNTASGCDSSCRLIKCGHHYRGSGLTRDRVCGLPPTVTCGHHYRGCSPLTRWTKGYLPIAFVVNKNTSQKIFIRPLIPPAYSEPGGRHKPAPNCVGLRPARPRRLRYRVRVLLGSPDAGVLRGLIVAGKCHSRDFSGSGFDLVEVYESQLTASALQSFSINR